MSNKNEAKSTEEIKKRIENVIRNEKASLVKPINLNQDQKEIKGTKKT